MIDVWLISDLPVQFLVVLVACENSCGVDSQPPENKVTLLGTLGTGRQVDNLFGNNVKCPV